MRNVLSYYYNLNFDEIKEYTDYGVLKRGEEVYIFKKYIQNEEETKQITMYLYNQNVPVHTIIINNQNEMTTNYNNEKYVLLLLQNVSLNIDKKFLMVIVPKKENDIAKLWSTKIDYYMRQVRELALGKELLINSFNYYIGMAENAIAIYNRANELNGEVKYSICHRRIQYPNYSLNYLDPTNMMIDARVRDISGYIKAKFFSDNITIEEVLDFIFEYGLNDKEINILYARLFYPTYYFDIFEDGVVSEYEEKDILRFLEKREQYEKLLNDYFIYLKDTHFVYEIEWIKK